MGTIDDGYIDETERAFARPYSQAGGAGYMGQRGMSLRDYFAAQALAAGFREYLTTGSEEWMNYDDFADTCYAMADAMMVYAGGIAPQDRKQQRTKKRTRKT